MWVGQQGAGIITWRSRLLVSQQPQMGRMVDTVESPSIVLYSHGLLPLPSPSMLRCLSFHLRRLLHSAACGRCCSVTPVQVI